MLIDPKLKPLYHETTFWIMLAMSLPGIVSTYLAAWNAMQTGEFDPGAFQSAILALPIVGYLLARQYPRGKAAEAAGLVLASGRDERMAQQFAAGFDAAAGFDNEAPDGPKYNLLTPEEEAHLHSMGAPILPNADEDGSDAAEGRAALDALAPEDPNLLVTVTNPATGETFTVTSEVAALMDAEEEPADENVIDEPDDGFGKVSEGGPHDAVNTDAEAVDAAAKEPRA